MCDNAPAYRDDIEGKGRQFYDDIEGKERQF